LPSKRYKGGVNAYAVCHKMKKQSAGIVMTNGSGVLIR
jgi:hypothetical protein